MKENKPKLQSIFCSLSAKTGLVRGSLEDLVVRLILKSNNDKLVNANTWTKVYEFINREFLRSEWKSASLLKEP